MLAKDSLGLFQSTRITLNRSVCCASISLPSLGYLASILLKGLFSLYQTMATNIILCLITLKVVFRKGVRNEDYNRPYCL